MINPSENAKVACCNPIGMQRATFPNNHATDSATDNATDSLKAIADAVLKRNTQGNNNATHPLKSAQLLAKKNDAKVARFSGLEKAEYLIVTCYTPAGNPIEVQARNADHAAWLLRMNPKPRGTGQ